MWVFEIRSGRRVNKFTGRDFVASRRPDVINLTKSGLAAVVTYLWAFLLPRHRLALECAALRQQWVVFKRKQPRPKLAPADRLSWSFVPRIYSG